ncbi:hypothetical protein CUMW_031700 [Citrus unshiu]|nr:hypothetical protein CUMW_031700 [Citrus unshiu]
MYGRTNSDPSLKQERKRGEDSNKKWIHNNKNAGTKTIREERTTIKLRLCVKGQECIGGLPYWQPGLPSQNL